MNMFQNAFEAEVSVPKQVAQWRCQLLRVDQMLKKFPLFLESEYSLACTKTPVS